MLQRMTPITPEKRERGFRAEARFFHIAENARPGLRPRGFAHVHRASALLDARGVDGFVYHFRGSRTPSPTRIPIQLKTGYDGTSGHDWDTEFGISIPIVPISIHIDPYNLFERIRKLLDAHERTPRDYEEALQRMETIPPTRNESEMAELITSCRERFPYPALPAFV